MCWASRHCSGSPGGPWRGASACPRGRPRRPTSRGSSAGAARELIDRTCLRRGGAPAGKRIADAHLRRGDCPKGGCPEAFRLSPDHHGKEGSSPSRVGGQMLSAWAARGRLGRQRTHTRLPRSLLGLLKIPCPEPDRTRSAAPSPPQHPTALSSGARCIVGNHRGSSAYAAPPPHPSMLLDARSAPQATHGSQLGFRARGP